MAIDDLDISIFNEEALIDSVTITNKGTDLRSFEVTLRNDKVYNRYNKLADRIADLESAAQKTASNNAITPVQDTSESKVEAPAVGFDEKALGEYLKENEYSTKEDITALVTPISEEVESIKISDTEQEKRLTDLEKLWSYDKKLNAVKTTLNIITEGTISMSGEDEGESEDNPTVINSIDDISDVAITNPKKGDVLTYDDVNDEWVNKPNQAGLDKEELEEYLTDNEYAKKSDIPEAGLDEKALGAYLRENNYAKQNELFTSMASNTNTPVNITVGGVTKTIEQATLRKSLGLGTAAYESKDTFATQEALNETDAEVDEHTKIVNTLQQTLVQATATIAELQRRLAIVEDWGFQFDMTAEGSRILVTPHNFVSEGAISFSGESINEEFEQKIVLITEDEYNTLVESGQVNETKIYYVY